MFSLHTRQLCLEIKNNTWIYKQINKSETKIFKLRANLYETWSLDRLNMENILVKDKFDHKHFLDFYSVFL